MIIYRKHEHECSFIYGQLNIHKLLQIINAQQGAVAVSPEAWEMNMGNGKFSTSGSLVPKSVFFWGFFLSRFLVRCLKHASEMREFHLLLNCSSL